MIKIRKYKKGDEKGIVKLTNLVFPMYKFSIKDWDWRHKHDKKNISVAIDDKGQIIGHWAYLEKSLRIQKKILKSGITLAAMIHPLWQKKGIFSQIANRLFKNACNNKILYLFGFPNDYSLPIHIKYGFKYIKSYNIYKKTVSSIIVSNKNSQRNYIFRVIKNFPQNTPENYSDIIKVSKVNNYLNWRYLEIPSEKYFVFNIKKGKNNIGEIVFKYYQKKEEKHLHLIDILISEKDINEKLLREVFVFWTHLAIRSKAKLLSTWLQGLGCLEDRIIEKYHFVKDEAKTFHLTVKNIGSKILLDKKAWEIRMGDTEIF